MSHFIVLVKQVPDVSQISDNAFDPNTGNLIRARLPSVINELDAQALAFAMRMKKLTNNPQSKLICLTMGPPMAVEVLRYGLARFADGAVLLTDRLMGGADTCATANPLAYATRKIVAEMLAGSDDYFVVAGMQSVDGDTAQVPAQLADELGVPCIAFATGVEKPDQSLQFWQQTSGGRQLVEPTRLPAVITVANYDYPLYPSFAAYRRAQEFEIVQWGAEDINATALGAPGSKTRVVRVFPPPKPNRKCQRIESVAELAAKLHEIFSAEASSAVTTVDAPTYQLPLRRQSPFERMFEGTQKECDEYKQLSEQLQTLGITSPEQIDAALKAKLLESGNLSISKKMLEDMLSGYSCVEPDYQGAVWVMVELTDSGEIHATTLELLGKASELASSLEVKVGAVLVGDKVEPQAAELIAYGADIVYLLENPLLATFDPVVYAKVVTDLFESFVPQIMLYGATHYGRVLAPIVAYQTGCGLTADCTALDIRDSSRRGQIAILMQTRPALGGNIMATICTKDSRAQMATARQGVMQRLPRDPKRTGEVIRHHLELDAALVSLKVLKQDSSADKVNFAAQVIVSGGKGLQTREQYNLLLQDLVAAIRKAQPSISVETGASRAAVEQGLAERAYQVGQTGTAVSPKLYLALAISGAIQHMIGVAKAETIVALNSDPDAPIFAQCDYYMVGNVETIVPQLVEAMQTQVAESQQRVGA